MKRLFSVTIISLLIFNQSFSQNDSQAKTILDEFATTMKSYSSITTSFSFTLNNSAENINDTYNGAIVLQKNMYKVELMGAVAYCNGKTRWTHMVEQGDVNVTEPDLESNDVLENPQKIFSIYEKEFHYKKQPDINTKGRLTNVIDLTPLNKDFAYTKISLSIDKQTKEPTEIRYFGKDGNNYIIKINSFKANTKYNESFFVFDKTKFPKAEIIDMR